MAAKLVNTSGMCRMIELEAKTMHVYKGMLEVKAPERVAKCWDGQLARV